jgi:hypothetical protein
MDEQRILEEMERMLAADDPRLAARLAAFGQPGFGQVLRTRRARATLSVMLLILIAAVAAVIYVMSQFGAATEGPRQPSSSRQASPPSSQLTTPRARASDGSASGASARPGGNSSGTMTQKCTPTYAPACDASWTQVNAKGNAGLAQQQSAQQ